MRWGQLHLRLTTTWFRQVILAYFSSCRVNTFLSMILDQVRLQLFYVIQDLGSQGLYLQREGEELLLGQFMLGQVLLGDDITCSRILK